MKEIKLSGREQAVLRGIESQGSTGAEILERTNIDAASLCDLLNGLMETGLVEIFSPAGEPVLYAVTEAQMGAHIFDTNPSYTQEIKKVLMRR